MQSLKVTKTSVKATLRKDELELINLAINYTLKDMHSAMFFSVDDKDLLSRIQSDVLRELAAIRFIEYGGKG